MRNRCPSSLMERIVVTMDWLHSGDKDDLISLLRNVVVVDLDKAFSSSKMNNRGLE